MPDTSENESGFEELKGLVNASFPELRCLRCGNEQFFLTSDIDALGTGKPGSLSKISLHTLLSDPENPVITLACTRCGYLEHHMTGIMRRAEKPIRGHE
jgi:predicted nucleic-acid-binding Zn-ribbon protein